MPNSCLHCGHTLQAGVKFCTACGKACTTTNYPGYKNCPDCHASVRADSSFCTNCGSNISALSAASSPKLEASVQAASETQRQPVAQPQTSAHANDKLSLDLPPPAAHASNTRWLIAGLTLVCVLVVAGLGGWYWYSHKKPADDLLNQATSSASPQEETIIAPQDLPATPTDVASPPATAQVESAADTAPQTADTTVSRKLPEGSLSEPKLADSKAVVSSKKTRPVDDDEESDEEFFDEVDVKAMLRKAEQALRRGQSQRAAELAQDVLANDPNNRRARQILIEARLPRN